MCPTCSVDAGHSVGCEDEVRVTVADDALGAFVAFAALTVAAVLDWTYDHLSIPLHNCEGKGQRFLFRGFAVAS